MAGGDGADRPGPRPMDDRSPRQVLALHHLAWRVEQLEAISGLSVHAGQGPRYP